MINIHRCVHLFMTLMLLTLFCSQAEAHDDTWLPAHGMYSSIFGGLHLLSNNAVEVNVSDGKKSLQLPDESLDFDPGYNIGGALGYQFPEFKYGDIRLEGEFSHASNPAETITVVGKNFNAISNSETKGYFAMANIYYDLNLNAWHYFDTRFIPYFGLGLGWGHVRHRYGFKGDFFFNPRTGATDDVVYQGIIGLGYGFNPQFTAGVEYRYFASSSNSSFSMGQDGYTGSFDTDRYESHSINLVMRYQFAPPADTATYLVPETHHSTGGLTPKISAQGPTNTAVLHVAHATSQPPQPSYVNNFAVPETEAVAHTSDIDDLYPENLSKHYTIQLIGAYDRQTAEQFVTDNRLGNTIVYQTRHSGNAWFEVLYGNFTNIQDAKHAARDLPVAMKALDPWVRTLPTHRTG